MKNPIHPSKLPESIVTLSRWMKRMSFAPLLFGVIHCMAQPCLAAPGVWEYTGNLEFPSRRAQGRIAPRWESAGHGRLRNYRDRRSLRPGDRNLECHRKPQSGRYGHTATLLPDGRVLVAGGNYIDSTKAELYDPATGTWTFTGSLETARQFHTATLLGNGKVLVAGGYDGSTALASAELYDPATGTWSFTGSLHQARGSHTANLLNNGKVLVAGGGSSVPMSELYDPATGSWTLSGSLNRTRAYHTATLLSNGKVLIAGGDDADCTSAEVYNPTAGTWSLTGSLNAGRYFHAATLLPDGTVLAEGGLFGTILASSELYNPASGTWTFTGKLNQARSDHTATLLTNGVVLVAGGEGNDRLFNSAELYGTANAVTTVDGYGKIDGKNSPATFHFSITQSSGSPTGTFIFSDLDGGIYKLKGRVRSLVVTGNSADFSGRGHLDDGTPVNFEVSAVDNGNGTSDTFSVSLTSGYTASGNLIRGDIRILTQ
jgi:hypothetical protein